MIDLASGRQGLLQRRHRGPRTVSAEALRRRPGRVRDRQADAQERGEREGRLRGEQVPQGGEPEAPEEGDSPRGGGRGSGAEGGREAPGTKGGRARGGVLRAAKEPPADRSGRKGGVQEEDADTKSEHLLITILPQGSRTFSPLPQFCPRPWRRARTVRNHLSASVHHALKA